MFSATPTSHLEIPTKSRGSREETLEGFLARGAGQSRAIALVETLGSDAKQPVSKGFSPSRRLSDVLCPSATGRPTTAAVIREGASFSP